MQQARRSTPPDGREASGIFGLGDPVGDVVLAARGEMGRIWRLVTTTGSWALKEVFDPGPTGPVDARRDAAFQAVALAAGIPMPRPIPAMDGRILVEVGPPRDRRSVRVYSWVDLRGREVIAPLEEVASILGRLHAVAPADDRPPHSWYVTPPDRAVWPDLLERARAVGASWAGALERMIGILLDTTANGRARTAETAGLVTCHLDYNPENVLVDAAGRVCVVDWENSGAGTLEAELASAVAEFCRTSGDAPRFLRAYRAGGGPARLRDRSSFAMTLVVQANLIHTYARRALEAADPEDARRAAFWVEDITANAFTIERVDGWLDAARSAGLA
jgi:Ser/Thr protein kinase RdoA (MazF antagonist)